ncbi:CotH kinase family protein [uncultured Sunxiuqinia sp.]|uniref:CotH kinase family protein n=1 Tax=uncultured Sunxiuqinia sp. TaxID=1573825 RepID=UPI002605CE50|nr:CotH kinase family protein [uncultured Sunxiuqinia sp.]
MRNCIFFLLLLLCSTRLAAQSLSSFGTSNLPLVVVDTDGRTIPDDPKIDAQMGIIWNGEGKVNSSKDAFNDYNGHIAIERRGSSSQGFPKKSYGFELRDAAGLDLDASILGLPAEEDWILYGPYSDKTLIRNVLVFTLGASLGHYAPRCRFVELFLNEQYQGVYVLMEKIKRDKKRLDLAKLKPEDLSGEDLTGGYIIKIDKTTGSGGSGWYSAYLNEQYKRTFFQYEYPKQEEIQVAQKDYIKNYIDQVEQALHDKNLDGTDGFRALADEESFIDFLIVNELAKNVDGYRLSTFLHKDKNGKLKLGPVWDFNLAFGNVNYHNGASTSGFQFEANLGDDAWQNPFWWPVLFEDNTFRKKLKNRWNSLRKNQLSDERIQTVVDSLTSLLDEAQVRNFTKWPVLSTWVWPNAYVGNSYTAEVNWLESWIHNRLKWLDTNLEDLYVGESQLAQAKAFSVYPNPFSGQLHLELPAGLNDRLNWIIYSVQGAKVAEGSIEAGGRYFTIQNAQVQALPDGVYLLRIRQHDEVVYTQKLVKQ